MLQLPYCFAGTIGLSVHWRKPSANGQSCIRRSSNESYRVSRAFKVSSSILLYLVKSGKQQLSRDCGGRNSVIISRLQDKMCCLLDSHCRSRSWLLVILCTSSKSLSISSGCWEGSMYCMLASFAKPALMPLTALGPSKGIGFVRLYRT